MTILIAGSGPVANNIHQNPQAAFGFGNNCAHRKQDRAQVQRCVVGSVDPPVGGNGLCLPILEVANFPETGLVIMCRAGSIAA